MLMPLSDTLAVLPARSTHVPVTDRPAPSPTVTGDGVPATPDRASEQVKLTVTGSLFQPYRLGWTFLELVMLGGVRSIFIPIIVAEFVFPALSVQIPATDFPWPSADRANGLEDEATPDKESVHAKLTVTVLLFQPLALAEGDLLPIMVGGVRSMFMLPTVTRAVFPALSVQVPVTDWP